MELRHLRYFTAVAEHLNYSEASRRIHVAKPAISQTILDLEEELGVRLLLRDRRTVLLLVESGIGVSILSGSVRHLLRAGGLVVFLPVPARFPAPRVANELAAGRAIVAHSRSFSRSRAEPAGGDPGSDGGETGRKETARGAQAVTSCFLTKRNVQMCRGGREMVR
jgi:DNA-binding transcriptional LysR family regulator